MNLQSSPARKPECVPPPLDGDFYRAADLLNDERAALNPAREDCER